MEDRFNNILSLLSGESGELQMGMNFSPYVVESFQEVDRNEHATRFQLQTKLSMMMRLADPTFKHRNEQTFVNFYPPTDGGNIFTAMIEHYFGQLGLRGTGDYNNVETLCLLLAKNTGTFLGTGAYLGLTMPQNNTVYASLNSMLHFVDQWPDEQVASILLFQLAGMFKGLENNWDDSFTILKRFGDRA